MSFTYAVNCSILFTELPLLERPAAAARAGFSAVEFWWPFPTPDPSEAEVDAFVDAIEGAEVRLIGLNFYAGDMPGGERGVLSDPVRGAEFRRSVDIAVGIAERLGCPGFNALYGNQPEGLTDAERAERQALALENILYAARAMAPGGGTVLIEPISGAPAYPLKTAAEAVAVVEQARAAGAANVAFLYDAYHLAANGDPIEPALAANYATFGHVQIADHPGRGEPGTGSLDLDGILDELRSRGWDKYVALEYKPTVESAASLAWLPMERRGPGQG